MTECVSEQVVKQVPVKVTRCVAKQVERKIKVPKCPADPCS